MAICSPKEDSKSHGLGSNQINPVIATKLHNELTAGIDSSSNMLVPTRSCNCSVVVSNSLLAILMRLLKFLKVLYVSCIWTEHGRMEDRLLFESLGHIFFKNSSDQTVKLLP